MRVRLSAFALSISMMSGAFIESPAQTGAENTSESTATTIPAVAPNIVPVPAPLSTPVTKPAATAAVAKIAKPQIILDESAINKTLGSLALPGWEPRALEAFPRSIAHAGSSVDTSAVDNVPAFQLYGLEPHIYDILAEFGVRKAFKKTYQRGQRFLQIGVYVFATPQGAYGAYNFMRQGSTTVVVRGSGSSEDDSSISFWKGNSFVRLTQTSEDDEESKGALRVIAQSLEAALPGGTLPPQVLSQLPVIDRVSGSEKLVMGPHSGKKFFPAPYVSSLSLERAKGAVTSDYRFQLPPERLKLLLIDYGSKSVANAAYSAFRDNLDADHELTEIGGDAANTDIVKLENNSWMLVQLRGPRVFVITGARKKVSPLMLARQIM
ncbi:MAG: hypothetical protein IAF58_04270 [Leptolyngbya sp.]|nr:hypothetical protein [Candidatus Melainabacteria bacterium]